MYNPNYGAKYLDLYNFKKAHNKFSGYKFSIIDQSDKTN